MEESQASDYYHGLNQWTISALMKDFDDPNNYTELSAAVTSSRSRNFLLDFDDDHAWCGFDLDADAFGALLKSKRPPSLNTRWINIWLPHEQKDVLEVLAKHYDFTPRLLGFMQAPPLRQPRSTATSKTSLSSVFRRSKNTPVSTTSSEKPLGRVSPEESVLDPSLNSRELIGMIPGSGLCSQSDFAETLNPYFLANEIWHYSSVDWGRRYVCIGYNTLHNVPSKGRTAPADEDLAHEDRPYGKRLWNWLILCEDRTVISVHEDPYPTKGPGILSRAEQVSLTIIRRNLVNTFRQLSKARDDGNDQAQMQLPLRRRLGNSEEETNHRSTDAPGMLFYYLFDDWLNTYSLIARREHRYASELNRLRVEMLQKAELAHVDRLHHVGRQLGVLKRIYQSYEMIIDRVLEKQEPTLASLKNSRVMDGIHSMEGSISAITPGQISENQILGVSISSAARARFERLQHRIRLYALNEVIECLDQKDSLVMMNFNLIAIKESYSVERLTRITLLLAKVTMLFMPVSLMSAYFGCQFTDAAFTVQSYWIWFGGIMAASVILLLGFSLASGTMEKGLISKPLGKRVVDFGSGILSRTRKKVDDSEMEEMMF